MLREILAIFFASLLSIKLLYEFRDLSLIGRYLPTLAAAILIYFPVFHVTLRRIPVGFFEKNPRAFLKSLKYFAAASLVLFPPFLLMNHLYQKILFGREFVLSFSGIPFETILIQLVLIAFPEEFFFRGWLQTLLARTFPRRIGLGFPALSVGVAVPITSFLFAFSHSLITLQWWHFAIFFPSLVFGWLREKTGGLIAPILFHVSSNLLVNWIGTSYR